MTIEQKILSKLQPHAKRIQDGDGNDFDYLPAVLLQLIEEQKHHAKQLEDTAKLLDSLKRTIDTIEVASKAQITALGSATQRKLDQLQVALKDTQSQLEKSQSTIAEQIAVSANSHAAYAMRTAEGLSNAAPLVATITGSTMSGGRLPWLKNPVTTRMISVE